MGLSAARVYPALVGLLLGVVQTALFLQLSFALSSTFGTFLLVTLSWLLGSALGAGLLAALPLRLRAFLALLLAAYAGVVALLTLAPFNTALWPLYGALIAAAGVYPGVFFARQAQHYRTSDLFFGENNGFILGMVTATLLFLLLGRPALWAGPPLLAAIVALFPAKQTPSTASIHPSTSERRAP